jgi:hypothetical protein
LEQTGAKRCPGVGWSAEGCGETVEAVRDVTERWIRDLPVLDAET